MRPNAVSVALATLLFAATASAGTFIVPADEELVAAAEEFGTPERRVIQMIPFNDAEEAAAAHDDVEFVGTPDERGGRRHSHRATGCGDDGARTLTAVGAIQARALGWRHACSPRRRCRIHRQHCRRRIAQHSRFRNRHFRNLPRPHTAAPHRSGQLARRVGQHAANRR